MVIGGGVIYVDAVGKPHNALLTAVWGEVDETNGTYPGVNVVFVSGDETKDDPYGRQIERDTSVVHKGDQYAHGNYWMWPDEELTPRMAPTLK